MVMAKVVKLLLITLVRVLITLPQGSKGPNN